MNKLITVALALAALTACNKTPAPDNTGKPSAPAPAAKPVEATPAPAPAPASNARTIEQVADQYRKDQSNKGVHVTVKGLYMTTTKGKDGRAIAIALKSDKDAMDILECDAGSNLDAFVAAEQDMSQWTPITVEGDVSEKNWTVALANCSFHKT